MTIRWAQPANDDFLDIISWIAADNPAAASSIGRRILDAVERLDDFPSEGERADQPARESW
jgi:plasmid stabilization system protein ParE